MKQSSDHQARLHKLGDAHLVAELVRLMLDAEAAELPLDAPAYAELRRRDFSAEDIALETGNLVNIARGGSPVATRTRFKLLRNLRRIKQVALAAAVVSVLLFAIVFSGQMEDDRAYPILGGVAFTSMLLAFLAYSRLSITRLRLSQHESDQEQLEAERIEARKQAARDSQAGDAAAAENLANKNSSNNGTSA